MSMFEDTSYRWRETYFVLFRSGNRPTLTAVEQVLSVLDEHYTLTNLKADESGLCESFTLLSPEDFAALDVCYTGGSEVLEEGASLAEEMTASARDTGEGVCEEEIRQYDGRFEVLHFERLPDESADDDPTDEMLDPGALLLVLGALARLTDGVAVDPQAGTILSDEV
ncbi:MAG TPA: hypothetical protein VMY37_02260 [Thermoguttaceae bacterium]|nr:hypothetical protein [Thermoguttaceae bacterium]